MGKYKLNLNQDAVTDIQEAVDWYEEQKIGLGLEFIDDFDKIAQVLQENPYLYPKLTDKIRKALMQKFPYATFYESNEEKAEVEILAILHQKRDPELLKKRIKDKK